MSNLANQIEWSPPVETGLSSDSVYLSEEIEEHAESPSAAHSPGVYVLELSKPAKGGHETHSRLWLEDPSNRTLPPYMDEIVEADRLLYVGSASNEGGVYERLRTHIDANKPGGVNQSTTIASTFPIHSIVEINFHDTPQEARDDEHAHAMELTHRHPNAYVHCR
jgi:hypothetical protein